VMSTVDPAWIEFETSDSRPVYVWAGHVGCVEDLGMNRVQIHSDYGPIIIVAGNARAVLEKICEHQAAQEALDRENGGREYRGD
jgi:hypothetical protein